MCLLIACGQAETPTPVPPPTLEPTATATVVAVVTLPPTQTATPLPTPTLRPTATATPLPPNFAVDYQVVGPDGLIQVESITISEPGWLAIYPASAVQIDATDALGYTAIDPGRTEMVTIQVDEATLPQAVQVALHGERTSDAFEPTADNLLLIENLTVDTANTLPEIRVSDQTVVEDGLVYIDYVRSQAAGWVTIYAADDTQQHNLLGYTSIKAGENQAVPVVIRWREATPDLVVNLIADDNQPLVFDADDAPVMVFDEAVSATMRVALPPDIVIYNQPVIEGRFLVERLVSNGAGWLVVYEDSDADGQPGFIIGTEYIDDGLTEYLTVEVDETAVSDRLLVTIHDDTGDLGIFDFPANDPRRDYQDQAYFVEFVTNSGSFIIAEDQALSADQSLTISLIAVDRPTWVVIVNDVEGAPGDEELGRTLIPAGANQGVTVTIDDPTSSVVHVRLRQDAGTLDLYEPDTTDLPIEVDLDPVTAPITLLTGG